jgi:hypothetical protein
MHSFIHFYAQTALMAWFIAAMFQPIVLTVSAVVVGWRLGDKVFGDHNVKD